MTASAAPSSPWLVTFHGDPDAPVRLVCFTHAGGGAVTYHPWSRLLKPEISVRAVQLPGRESRYQETPLRGIGEIVAPVTAALSSLTDRPYLFFGHSMGALVAFEVARRLCGDGLTGPSALIVSGHRAPQLPSRAEPVAHLAPRDVVLRIAKLHGGIPPALLQDPGVLAMMGRVLQADLDVLEQYRYMAAGVLPCPIFAVGGEDDTSVSRDELAAWSEHTTSHFDCRQFPGDHFYLRLPGSQNALLDVVRERCREALVGGVGSP